MNHNGVKTLIAIAAVSVLAGCAGSTGGTGTEQPPADTRTVVAGGNAVISLSTQMNTPFDPVQATQQVARQIMDPICERLYKEQPDGSAVPMLATEMPEISDDNLTLTVPLRENVVFNDGTPFNAEAVKYNLDRAVQDPLSIRRVAKEYIKSVEIVDEYTVEIALTRPYSPILAELTDFTGMIASPAALQAGAEKFGNAPVCVGPFEWSERVPGGETVITKSDRYYDKDLVNLDSVTFVVVEDSAVATNVESGDIQFGTVDEAFVARMKDSTGVRAATTLRSGANGIVFNLGNVAGSTEPYGAADNVMAKHPELREAFALAINRDALSQAATNGFAAPGCSPIFASSRYASENECLPYDIERAKELVAKSGVPTPIKLELKVPNYPIPQKTGPIVQQMVKEVGFDVEIVPQEGLATFGDLRTGNFELVAMPISPVNSDPTFALTFETGLPNNWAGYSSPEFDALVKAARETFDDAERTELYREAIEEQNRTLPYVYTGAMMAYWATSKNFVLGEDVSLMGTIDLKSAGFSELP